MLMLFQEDIIHYFTDVITLLLLFAKTVLTLKDKPGRKQISSDLKRKEKKVRVVGFCIFFSF